MVKRIPGPVIWGWGLTVLVAFGAVVLGFGPICEDGVCQTKFAALWAAPPNEIGDTLAGFAGALAFVWIIVTVMLQSAELRAQVEELRLTKIELEKMATAQDAQVILMREQTNLLTKQAQIEEQVQNGRIAKAKLEQVREKARQLLGKPITYVLFDGSARAFSPLNDLKEISAGSQVSKLSEKKLFEFVLIVFDAYMDRIQTVGVAFHADVFEVIRKLAVETLDWIVKSDVETRTKVESSDYYQPLKEIAARVEIST